VADEQPCGEVSQDQRAERDVDEIGDVGRGQERCRDDEQDRDDVEREQRVAEANTARRRSFIQRAQLALQMFQGHRVIFTLPATFSRASLASSVRPMWSLGYR
jgi:hypothetical protein